VARFDLEFRLDQLVFDVPSHRAALGPAFAAVLSDAAIAATREHMLGPDNMQAERYPLVRIHSLQITGEAPKFAARVAVELHGQTREMQLPLTVTGLPQRVNASGALVLRQSDFGVQPYSVMNGLLAVQDDVVLEFNLAGE
jgi:polyisoprenoid-binding protein YceI